MIGFVTWPPLSYHHYYKGDQVTKPIIVVKICYKLLYVIQVVKKRFLINNFLASADIKVFGRTHIYVPIYNAASDWLHTFLHPGCFCLAVYTYVHIHIHI